MSQSPLWLTDCRYMILTCGFRLFWSLKEKVWRNCWFNLSVSNRREKMNSWRGWSVTILPLESELETICVFSFVVYLTPFRNFQIAPSFSKLLLKNHIPSRKPYLHQLSTDLRNQGFTIILLTVELFHSLLGWDGAQARSRCGRLLAYTISTFIGKETKFFAWKGTHFICFS